MDRRLQYVPSYQPPTLDGLPPQNYTADNFHGGRNLNITMDIGEGGCYSCLCFECIRTQQVGVVENFGQYSSMLSPGMNVICYPLQTVTARLSLRIQQLDVICETKTKDNVFVTIGVAVQYRILSERAYDAHYRLTDPHQQIRSYVYDVVRSTVPKMDLDQAFANKNKIAESVRQQLSVDMTEYGYEIKASLVTDLSPDNKVKQSMNQINASKRLKEAATEKAEADKIRQVKAAEAEAEARYLSGVGVARQRKAIIQGLQTSVVEFADEVGGITSKDVMDVLLLSQYMETLSSVGANTLFLEHDPACVANLQQQLSSNFMQKPSSRVRKQKVPDVPDGKKSISRERSKRKSKKETPVKGNFEQLGEDVLGSFGNMGKAVFG